jgi:hypothetical protein
MRMQLSIIVLVALSSGAGFWLGQAHVNRRDWSTARPTFSGNVNVVVDGATLGAGNAVLSNSSNSLAVDGDLKMRSLPNGELALEGNLNVRPN